jgi:hypothetical protein
LNRRLGGLQRWSGHDEKKFPLMQGIEPQMLVFLFLFWVFIKNKKKFGNSLVEVVESVVEGLPDLKSET